MCCARIVFLFVRCCTLTGDDVQRNNGISAPVLLVPCSLNEVCAFSPFFFLSFFPFLLDRYELPIYLRFQYYVPV